MWGRIYPHAVLLTLANIVLRVSCKGSLTFLIDDTGSMQDDIDQVKTSVKRISNAELNEKSSLISNMVLVTFNDPDAQVRVVTDNRNTFDRTLNAVYAHNFYNPDCWEPSMKGLILALDKSNSNSFIYVFTDAPAKDYRDGRYVKELCQKKQSQIIFVLTGYCYNYYESQAFDVYFDIAHACSGLAFDVSKTDVEQVLRTIEETIRGNKTVITSTIVPAGVKKEIPFTVDDHTDYAIVSVSGRNVFLDIKGPSPNYEKIMWNNNGKVVKLNNAKPGTYVATVMGQTKTSVVIVGRTDFFFTHGFSKLKPKSLGDTSLQPIADTNVHLSISVTDDHHTVKIVSAQILDMNENPMKTPMPLTEISKDFYVTGLFVAPSQRFKIAVHGTVKATGKPIKRIVKIPITPAEPPKILPTNTKPTVEIAEGKAIEIEYNSTMKLTCNVVAFPEPKIQWFNNNGGLMPSEMSVKEYPYKYISYMDISYASKGDRYKCYAVNDVGRGDKIINVAVKDPFTIKSTPQGITKLTYGTKGTITCDVTSRVPMDIQWFYANEMTGHIRAIETSDKYILSASRTQLTIKKMDLDLVGRYTCKVSLKNKKDVVKSFNTRVKIDGLIAPKVQGGNEIKATKGKTAIIECKVVSGAPAPKITWLFGGKGSTFTPLAGSESVLRISNVEDKHEGKYKCVAENVAGKDEHVSTLFVQEFPKITSKSSMVYQVTEGDALLRIPCVAAGVPKPVIVWKLSGRNITPSAKYSIEDGTLTIRNPKVSDTNSYTCEAQNEAGTVSSTFKTYIRQFPKLSGVASKSVRLGTPASIDCMIVKGEPKPKITWQFMDKSTSKFVPIAGSENTLRISSTKKSHAGNYKCVAKNDLGSDEHVTTLIVEFAPEIIKNSTTVEGIKGDLALRIPCDVVGTPKPVITWKLKGAAITPDSKYLIEDGALVIMKPTEKDSSLYTCEAKNSVSTVSTTFQATVEKLPTNFGTEHFVYLLEGETKKLKCDAYTSPSQSVKWFITKARPRTSNPSLSTTASPPELESSHTKTASSKHYSSTPSPIITKDAGIKEPSIQITKASITDHDGNYTCRVSDKHGNTQTHTYVVDVGSAPEFVTDDANSLSDWEGDVTVIEQNCDIQDNAKPQPAVKWTFNGKVFTDFNSAGVGHYTCNISNPHGSVQKIFDVTSSACLISRNLGNAHMQHMPLVLDDKGFWHKLKNTKHYSVVEHQEDKITLSCPSQKGTSNTFKNFTKKSTLEAFCYKDDSFLVEGNTYKLSDLQCTNSIQPSVIRKKVKCSTETSELIRVGYNNVPGFLEAYEVCFDTEKTMPLYTRIIMTETNNNGLSPGYSWYTYPGIGIKKTERGFNCKDTMSSCCYSKSQLVNAIDFNDGPAKKSTFIDPLNVIPVWLPCNNSRPSWENINEMVRSLLPIYIDIVTWSGTHTLQEKNGAIIPRYLWKVVKLDDDEAVAIVHVNDPKPEEKDIKCTTQAICDKYEDWFISSDKYTYCCSLPDFFKSFDIHATDIGESMDAALDKIEKRT